MVTQTNKLFTTKSCSEKIFLRVQHCSNESYNVQDPPTKIAPFQIPFALLAVLAAPLKVSAITKWGILNDQNTKKVLDETRGDLQRSEIEVKKYLQKSEMLANENELIERKISNGLQRESKINKVDGAK